MPQEKIIVVGAREHNLKNITVEIPRDRLGGVSGISGSGESSLAFDTIFAEGRRADGRDRHRGLRLPEAALRPGGRPSLPDLRAGGAPAIGPRDRRWGGGPS